MPLIFLLLNFSFKVLEKLPLCEEIPHEKSYLDILNKNQDFIDLRFMMMQILQWIALCIGNLSVLEFLSYLLCVHSLLYKNIYLFLWLTVRNNSVMT